MKFDDDDEYAAAVDVARTAFGTGRFLEVLEVAPTIFEFVRPNSVVYRMSICKVISAAHDVRYSVAVDATSSPAQRWRRTEYTGKGRSAADALQSAVSAILLDQAPFGDD